jgi:hypothetical protein
MPISAAVMADFALADQAALAHVHELDGILDGEDVPLDAGVDVIDQRGERGRLARAGLAGDQNQALGMAAHLPHRLRQLQFIHRQRLGRDGAKHGAHAVQVTQHVDPEASPLTHGVREVGAFLGLEAIDGDLGHDLV